MSVRPRFELKRKETTEGNSMETINGEWYLRGCSPDDPDCIHS